MLTLALLLIGFQAGRKLQISFLPDIDYPEFLIFCRYEGGSAQDIEHRLIRPLEASLSGIHGIRDMQSWSRDEQGFIHLKFTWNTDMQFAFLRVREKIDLAMDKLPRDIEQPSILDFNPSSVPVLRFMLSGRMDIMSLSHFAADMLQPRLAQVDGIAGISLAGTPEEAIQILIDQKKTEKYQLSHEDILRAIRNNTPGQSFSQDITSGYAVHKLTVTFPVDKPEDLLQLPLTNHNEIPLILGDIARVKRAPLPFYGFNYSDTSVAMTVSVYKEARTNTMDASDRVRRELENIRQEYPELQIEMINDTGSFVKEATHSLKLAIIFGSGLAFLIILLFLGELRSALLLLLIVPVTLIISFILFYLLDISMNFMTLGGLALAVGLIVDNGIVLLDSLFQNYDPGRHERSVTRGTQKVSNAIVASTLTSISIFIPLIYIKGYSSILFMDQAKAIIVTLLLSLFVSLWVVPALYSLMMRSKFTHPSRQIKARAGTHDYLFKNIRKGRNLIKTSIRPFVIPYQRINTLFSGLYRMSEVLYHQTLSHFLNHKKHLFILLLFIGGLTIIVWQTGLEKRSWPEIAVDQARLWIEVPDYVPFDVIQEEMTQTLQLLQARPEIDKVFSRIYSARAKEPHDAELLQLKPGFYSILFELKLNHAYHESEFRSIDFSPLISLPFTSFQAEQHSHLKQELLKQNRNDFQVFFQADNRDNAEELATEFSWWLTNDMGINDPIINLGIKTQVIQAKLNELMRKKYQLNSLRLSENLALMISGKLATTWPEGDKQLPVIVKNDQEAVPDIHELLKMGQIQSGTSLPYSSLFDVQKIWKTNEIQRVNQKRVISVEADIPGSDLNKVYRQAQQWIRNKKTDSEDIFFAEAFTENIQSNRDLVQAFILAVLIVYLLLAAQFESFIHPLNVMFTVPIGLSGAILTLSMMNQSLNVISIIGSIMLIGIGVNDAIIKLDYMVRLKRDEGLSVREAIMTTSRHKLRPVLMTTLTTIAAMLPMAFGYGGNAEINQPLALTIIGGLFFTTLFTLFVTPVLFELFEKD